jgi:hypothetical protein
MANALVACCAHLHDVQSTIDQYPQSKIASAPSSMNASSTPDDFPLLFGDTIES